MYENIFKAYVRPSYRKQRIYEGICADYDRRVSTGEWLEHGNVWVRSKNTCFFTTETRFTDCNGKTGTIIEYPTRTEVIMD